MSKNANPFTSDNGFDKSFEKVISEVQQTMPFKIEDHHYDRTPQSHAIAKEAARQNDLTQKDNMGPVGVKPPWEKIYNKEVLKCSALPVEYYYDVPMTREQLVEKRRRLVKAALATTAALVVASWWLNWQPKDLAPPPTV